MTERIMVEPLDLTKLGQPFEKRGTGSTLPIKLTENDEDHKYAKSSTRLAASSSNKGFVNLAAT